MPLGKREEIIRVDYGDFEQLVEREYGVEGWSFIADQECGNDSEHRFDVTKVDAEPDAWDTKQLEELKQNGHSSWASYVLLEDLVRRGVIEPGIYLVSVSW